MAWVNKPCAIIPQVSLITRKAKYLAQRTTISNVSFAYYTSARRRLPNVICTIVWGFPVSIGKQVVHDEVLCGSHYIRGTDNPSSVANRNSYLGDST